MFSLLIPKWENGSWTWHFQYINRLVKSPENRRFFAVCVYCFPSQSCEVFWELQDRPAIHEKVAFNLFFLVVSIQRTSSLTYDRDLWSDLWHPGSPWECSFVFWCDEEKRRLCLNNVKPLKLPRPKLLNWSILFSLVKLFFSNASIH